MLLELNTNQHHTKFQDSRVLSSTTSVIRSVIIVAKTSEKEGFHVLLWQITFGLVKY
jgi:hypothetical protein